MSKMTFLLPLGIAILMGSSAHAQREYVTVRVSDLQRIERQAGGVAQDTRRTARTASVLTDEINSVARSLSGAERVVSSAMAPYRQKWQRNTPVMEALDDIESQIVDSLRDVLASTTSASRRAGTSERELADLVEEILNLERDIRYLY